MSTPRRIFVIDVIPYTIANNGDIVYDTPMRTSPTTQWDRARPVNPHWCRHRVRATSTKSAIAKAIAEHQGHCHHSL